MSINPYIYMDNGDVGHLNDRLELRLAVWLIRSKSVCACLACYRLGLNSSLVR